MIKSRGWVRPVVAAAVVGAAALPALPAAATPSTSPSSIMGGGLENALAVSGSAIAVGGDTSGVSISTDDGKTWLPRNKGLADTTARADQDLHVASLYYTPAGVLWSLAGKDAGKGTMSRLGTGASVAWTHASTPTFTVEAGAQNPHPRPTGHLIDSQPNGTTTELAAVTASGFLRSHNGGNTWEPTVSKPTSAWGSDAPTAFIFDEGTFGQGYVTVSGTASTGGLWKVQNLNGSGAVTATKVTSPTSMILSDAQEVTAVTEGTKTVLYVAGGSSGIFRYDPSMTGAAAWDDLTPSTSQDPDVAVSRWTSVTGVSAGSTTTVWVGCLFSSNPSGTPANSLLRLSVSTAPGALSGVHRLTSDTISNTVVGTTATPWWHTDPSVQGAQPGARLGGISYIPTQLAYAPGAGTSAVLVAGRAGVWRADNSLSGGSLTWKPAVQGLSSTVARAVAVDPQNNTRVYEGDLDWSALVGDGNLLGPLPAAVPENEQPDASNSNNSGYDVEFDPPTGDVYISGGDSPTSGGYISCNPDPGINTNSWTKLSPPPANGHRVLGIAIGRHLVGGVNKRRVIAVVQDDNSANTGIYYTDQPVGSCGGAVTWTLAAAGLRLGAMTKGNHVDVWWPTNTNRVYVFDPNTGLWLSTDDGAAFTKIWSSASYDYNLDHSGFMAGDPSIAAGTRLYLSTKTAVLKIADTRTSLCASGTCAVTVVDLASGALQRPGALAVDSTGHLFVTQTSLIGEITAGALPDVFKSSAVPATTTSMASVADDGWAEQALEPTRLAVTSSGTYVYSSLDGSGVAVLQP